MRNWIATGIVLLWATVGTAAITQPGADGSLTLASAQVATGASATAVNGNRGWYSLVMIYATTAGTATVQTELSCDNGTTWVVVASSAKSIDSSGTAADGISVTFPQCAYRTNVTACSSCSVTSRAFIGGKVRP